MDHLDPIYPGLGRLAVVYGRLEALLRDVAIALQLDPGSKTLEPVKKEVRKRLVDWGVPIIARTDPAELVRWLDKLPDAVRKRDRLIHAAVSMQMGATDWMPITRHLRSGAVEELTPKDIEAVRRELATLHEQGLPLWMGLLAELRLGVYVPIFRVGYAGPAAVIAYQDDTEAWPKRPTDDELSEFWDDFETRFPPGSPVVWKRAPRDDELA